jgi:hypothetical protein
MGVAQSGRTYEGRIAFTSDFTIGVTSLEDAVQSSLFLAAVMDCIHLRLSIVSGFSFR